MTLFEALPDDITEALFSYCKDDECLNDATLRALRTELKLDKAEHNKYSHDCFRCDKFKELKNEVTAQIEKMKCCANCKHSEQGEYDEFENCSCCHAKDCYCRIKQQTRNSAGKYHDWDDKCDKWEIKEIAE